jgi:hypothetical protein
VICLDCYGECTKEHISDGFYYDYGSISGAWHDESYEGSSCCGAEAAEGQVWLDRVTTHVAKKDHKGEGGRIYIKAGERYTSRLVKGWHTTDSGEHAPIYQYTKRRSMSK